MVAKNTGPTFGVSDIFSPPPMSPLGQGKYSTYTSKQYTPTKLFSLSGLITDTKRLGELSKKINRLKAAVEVGAANRKLDAKGIRARYLERKGTLNRPAMKAYMRPILSPVLTRIKGEQGVRGDLQAHQKLLSDTVKRQAQRGMLAAGVVLAGVGGLQLWKRLRKKMKDAEKVKYRDYEVYPEYNYAVQGSTPYVSPENETIPNLNKVHDIKIGESITARLRDFGKQWLHS
jgi:hypothetical protein